MKPLSDQISRAISLFVHAQKTARDQIGPATDRRPFGDFNKTFPRPLRPLCNCHFSFLFFFFFSFFFFFFLSNAKRLQISRKLYVTGVKQQLDMDKVTLTQHLCYSLHR